MAGGTELRARTPSRSRSTKRDPLLAIIIGIVVCGMTLVGLQIAILVVTSLREGMLFEGGATTLENFRRVLGNSRFVSVGRNTVVLSLGTVVISLALALPLAWLYARTNLPHKKWLMVLLTIQVAVPGFLVAMGYLFLLNPNNGIVNGWVSQLTGRPEAVFNVYGLPWMVILQGVYLAPSAFFLLVPAFQGIDSGLEEAAISSGVPRWRIFSLVSLPMIRPAIMSAAILGAVVSMAMFDFAAVLGMPAGVDVFSTWIFRLARPGSGAPDYAAASTVGVVVLAVAMVALVLYFLSIRNAHRFVVMGGKRATQSSLDLGDRGKRLAWGLVWVYMTFATLIPFATLVWTSLVPFLQPPSAAALRTVQLAAYQTAWRELAAVGTNTAILVIVVPALAVAVALCAAWVSIRTRLPGRQLVEVAVMGGVAVPPIIGALAFLFLGLSIYQYLPIYSTIWLIVIAMVARFIPYGQRVISGTMVQLHTDLEDAARVAGVRHGRIMLSIVVPLVLPAAAFAWARIALLSLGELTMPLMLARPSTMVAATRIWTMQSSGQSNVAAAMGVVIVAVVIVGILAVHQRVEDARV